MNDRRPQALLPFVLILLSALASPLAAQRGEKPTPQPRPSAGSQGPRPAPSPRPVVAPAPRPVAAPMPRPSVPQNPVSRPAPSPRPSPVSRQPSIDPGPRIAPRPAPSPTPVYRQPGGARTPTPVAPVPRTNPYPTDPRVPGENRITRPSAPIAPAPVTRVRTDADTRTPNARDNVYRSPTPVSRDRDPAPSITRPGTRTEQPGYPGVVRTPTAPTLRTPEAREPTVRPRPSDARPGRYAPRDEVPRSTAPVVTARPRTPANTTTPNLRTGAAADATPRLVPRTTSPRLTVPRSGTVASGTLVNGVRGTARSTNYGSRGYVGYGSACHRTFWNSWWDPCRYDPLWNWSWYGGCSTFSWSVSLWHPWIWSRHRYWNDCYVDSWWDSYARPTCVATNYWWYPTTTYCPTYLYVPSSTVVYVERDAAPVDGGGEVVVAGGGGGSVARATEVVGDAGARGQPPEALAKKYVELGDFYFEAGRFAEALDAYTRAKNYAPDNASVHFALADAAFATGDYHFAAFLIAEALRLQPGIVSAEIDRRVYYGDPKLFEQQMEELERYVAAKPYDAQAQLVRGYNLRFSGKPMAAVAAFRRVLEIAPENRAAQAFLAALSPAASEATIR